MFGKQSANNSVISRLRTPLSKDTPSLTTLSATPSTSSVTNHTSENVFYDINDLDCAGRSTNSVMLCMSNRKSNQFPDITYLPKMSRKIDSFSLDDYPIFSIATQLTLLEWVYIFFFFFC